VVSSGFYNAYCRDLFYRRRDDNDFLLFLSKLRKQQVADEAA